MVDNGRQHAILPLADQQRADLQLGTRPVKVGKSQSNQGGIPIPLMGILVRTGFGEYASIVKSEDGDGAVEERN